jgi:hypothetical protein
VKVEVLYVAECPSHPAAARLVKDALAAEGVAAEIHEVLVRDDEMASELRFTGSPTIRINGKDVAGESQNPPGFGLSCRLYPGVGSGNSGTSIPEILARSVPAGKISSRLR